MRNHWHVGVLFALLITAFVLCPSGLSSEPAPTWEQLTRSALLALKRSDPVEAERLCNQAMKLVGEPVARDTRPAKTQALMGEIQRWQKKLDLAEESFKSAVALSEKAVGPNDPEMIPALESLANFYFFTRIQYDHVAALYRRILDMVERAPGSNSIEIANRARNVADIYRLQGRYAEAEPLYQKTLALSEKDNNELCQYLLASADFYRAWKKFDQAEPLASRALAIREKAEGIDTQLDIAVCLDSLAAILLAWNKPSEAATQYRKCVETIEKVSGSDSLDLVPRLTGLGAALRAQGKFEEAEAQYTRALSVTEKGLGPDFIEVAAVLEQYAELLNAMKKTNEAKAFLTRAESIRKNARE
jgi:tetratricopeptide (TPR) repeat protein